MIDLFHPFLSDFTAAKAQRRYFSISPNLAGFAALREIIFLSSIQPVQPSRVVGQLLFRERLRNIFPLWRGAIFSSINFDIAAGSAIWVSALTTPFMDFPPVGHGLLSYAVYTAANELCKHRETLDNRMRFEVREKNQ